MVELVGVSKRFGENLVVKDLSLTIGEGEFLTLLGPSGCGKTTTLRMIAGFEAPTAGEVRLDGQRVNDVPPYRRNVNTVFQSYALFPHLTVRENIAFGLKLQKLDAAEQKRRIDEAMERVKLPDLGERKPRQLSGGQQQRVALARALVCRPRVLLLDEPLGALDLKLRKAMQIELKQLQQALGMTFIYVTHDQEEALTMSDRIAVMNRGRIEQLGSGADVYHNPRTRFVAEFIGEANLYSAKVLRREGDKALVEACGFTSWVRSGEDHANDTLLIRPERLDLAAADAAPAGRNVVRGKVESVIFGGAFIRVIVAAPGGSITVQVLADDGHRHLAAVGREVALHWTPDDARLLAG
ncbi:MAG TPA: ABC transporter ATP-binding protein [Limnochordia bacterium]|nr:ABC transporter ATP-binding protein [Limnochordia bacterium]